MNVEIFDGTREEWDSYVHASQHSLNYHQSGWKEVIEKSFNHTSFYLAARDGSNRIKGILPLVFMKSALFGKFLVSLPFLNYGGMLSDNPMTEKALLEAASRILEKTGSEYLEMRHLQEHPVNLPTKHHKVTMILDLEKNGDDQWKVFNPKLRNQIRKSMKSNLTIRIGGLELLREFYSVFAVNMRDLGTPVYSIAFFRNVLEVFPSSTKIISVVHKNAVIASGIASWYRDTFEVPWASSLKAYKALCPNNLLYWEAIQFAIQHGFKRFDFGRSTPGEGTYKFKEQWGAKPVQLHWQYIMQHEKPLPELNLKNPKYHMAIHIWKKLPVGLTRIIGPPIVRNIP